MFLLKATLLHQFFVSVKIAIMESNLTYGKFNSARIKLKNQYTKKRGVFF